MSKVVIELTDDETGNGVDSKVMFAPPLKSDALDGPDTSPAVVLALIMIAAVEEYADSNYSQTEEE